MGWQKAKEPGFVKRARRIATLIERIRKETVESEARRIERMAETVRYFNGSTSLTTGGEKRSDDAVE